MISHLAAETSGNGNNIVLILVAVISGILALAGTAFGGWYTYRAAKENAKATREVEKDKLSTSSWESQVEQWRSDVVELRRQRAEDKLEYANHRAECAQEIEKLSNSVREVMDAHERDRREHREQRLVLERRIDALVHWGREVVVIMRAKGVAFPPPPPGVSDTDPNGFEAIPSISSD